MNINIYRSLLFGCTRYRFLSVEVNEPLIPTTEQPEGFRAYDKSIPKPKDESTNDGKYDPFAPVQHKRARIKNDFEFDPSKEFNIHPFWTPVVPIVVIGTGIFTIVTGVMANPPGDDDDED